MYQDLYGEGSFTGKGIYDVDAFEQATHGRFPENTLLSHDLIEGSFARAGLLTDIELFDDYPSRYLDLHAGASTAGSAATGSSCRGSGARVPGPDGRGANPLPLISRWKIFDNLRRSLVEPPSWRCWSRGGQCCPALRCAGPRSGARRGRGVDRDPAARGPPPAARQARWRAYYGAVAVMR